MRKDHHRKLEFSTIAGTDISINAEALSDSTHSHSKNKRILVDTNRRWTFQLGGHIQDELQISVVVEIWMRLKGKKPMRNKTSTRNSLHWILANVVVVLPCWDETAENAIQLDRIMTEVIPTGTTSIVLIIAKCLTTKTASL